MTRVHKGCFLDLERHYGLKLSMLVKNFSRRNFEIFFFSNISQKTGFISCKLSVSPKETICMKCQSLFLEKSKKNILNMLSAEFAPNCQI